MLVGAIILVCLGEMKDAPLGKGLESEVLWSGERIKNWKEKETINRISKDEEKMVNPCFFYYFLWKELEVNEETDNMNDFEKKERNVAKRMMEI